MIKNRLPLLSDQQGILSGVNPYSSTRSWKVPLGIIRTLSPSEQLLFIDEAIAQIAETARTEIAHADAGTGHLVLGATTCEKRSLSMLTTNLPLGALMDGAGIALAEARDMLIFPFAREWLDETPLREFLIRLVQNQE